MSCVPSASHVVWFRWDATETATITADTSDSGFDTVLAVYATGHCSLVQWSATEGQTYYIAVGSYADTKGGKLDLTLSD